MSATPVIVRLDRAPLWVLCAVATSCGGEPSALDHDASARTDARPDASAPPKDARTPDVETDSKRDAAAEADAASAIPSGGTILFQEDFDDTNFTSRGWTMDAGTLSTAEHAPGSKSSFECDFAKGGGACSAGSPQEHLFTTTDTVYVAFYLKYSANWIGSGLSYWPHMINMATTLDAVNWNPSNSYLTTYEEIVWDPMTNTGTVQLGLQDELNVDNDCILFADGTFNGCGGNPKTYVFTENRSVCSCNGIVGDLDQRDCFSYPQSSPSPGLWYSSRTWAKPGVLTDANKTDWHFIEAYFAMNSIKDGIGVPDGKIRWVQDGVTLISDDHILMRTGVHATMQFLKFLFGMYIGPPGAPVAETFWLDSLTVATARPE
jgi:hypothetical protein